MHAQQMIATHPAVRLCLGTGAVASRRTGSNEPLLEAMLRACAQACRLCGDECERHAGHQEHCRVCAEACRACESLCERSADSIGAARH